MPLQGHLSVERMCVGPGKPGQFLSPLAAWMVDSASMALRLQTGYCELRAQGMSANHKRIARIMRDDNLLAARQHWFRRPEHSFRAARVHLNLAARMTLSGPNQLWAADITYIRLVGEFVYLAVMLDVFSRKVIGWALGRSLKAKLPLSALERAVVKRKPPPGVVHHSDQRA
jgi:putative transposase